MKRKFDGKKQASISRFFTSSRVSPSAKLPEPCDLKRFKTSTDEFKVSGDTMKNDTTKANDSDLEEIDTDLRKRDSDLEKIDSDRQKVDSDRDSDRDSGSSKGLKVGEIKVDSDSIEEVPASLENGSDRNLKLGKSGDYGSIEKIKDSGSEKTEEENSKTVQLSAKLSKLTNLNNLNTRTKLNNRKTPSKSNTQNILPKLTPLEQQFVDLKSKNQDKILAIQVGYKFKFFGNDAQIASQILNIMLLPGNIELDERNHDRFAYCSIPDNRLHVHLKRLLNHGLKVAVVKQTESAAIKSMESTNKSTLFERKVTGVYTKATYMDDEITTGDVQVTAASLADSRADTDSYILCVDELKSTTSLVAVQPLTGDIIVDTFADTLTRDELETRLAYLNPSEIVVIGSNDQPSRETTIVIKLQSPCTNIQFRRVKSEESVQADLCDFFTNVDPDGRSKHLAEYYCLNYDSGVQSCVNELIGYLSEFQLSNVFTIPANILNLSDSRKYMLLPAPTLRSLEIFHVEDQPTELKGSLFWHLNHTHTKKGSTMLRNWLCRPLVDRCEIVNRVNAVEFLASGTFFHVIDILKNTLSKIGRGVDLDRSLIRIHYSATYGTEKLLRKDLVMVLKTFKEVISVFKELGESSISEFEETNVTMISSILKNVFEATKVDIVDTLLGQVNVSAALSEEKQLFFNIHSSPRYKEIVDELELIESVEKSLDMELQNIRNFLKRPQLAYTLILKDTHLIEVRNGKAVDSLPGDWLRISGTKSVSRFRPPEVQHLHKKLSYHQEMLLRANNRCFLLYLQEVDSHYEYFRGLVNQLSLFDCLLSLATASSGTVRCTKPKLVEEQVISVKDSVHPVLLNLAHNSHYVSNDIYLSPKERVQIITGPNMGGKSSYVKQVALLAIMNQVGCLLPCSEATIGVFDAIFTRMGASDNILAQKSTFMVEMQESASIIKNCTKKSLVILDEIGRGTGTSDGISLAYAILRYMVEDDNGPTTLFITHYPSLHVLEFEYSIVKNYHMAYIEKPVDEENGERWPEVIFIYKAVRGVVSNLYGLNVAQLAGIDKSIIDSAFDISEAMKREVDLWAFKQTLSTISEGNAHLVLHELSSMI